MSDSKVVAIFGSSTIEPGSPQWADAKAVGSRCAAEGLDIITGGYGGAMEAASKGAVNAGGNAIGVVAPSLFPQRSGANRHVSRVVEAMSLVERVGVLTESADGAIVLPGSVGTAAEMLIAWNLNHIARGNGGVRLPTVAVGEAWSELWHLLTGVGAHGADIHVTESIEDALAWLLDQPEIR